MWVIELQGPESPCPPQLYIGGVGWGGAQGAVGGVGVGMGWAGREVSGKAGHGAGRPHGCRHSVGLMVCLSLWAWVGAWRDAKASPRLRAPLQCGKSRR